MFLSDQLESRFERSYRKLFEYVTARNPGIAQIDADTKTVALLEAFVASHTFNQAEAAVYRHDALNEMALRDEARGTPFADDDE